MFASYNANTFERSGSAGSVGSGGAVGLSWPLLPRFSGVFSAYPPAISTNVPRERASPSPRRTSSADPSAATSRLSPSSVAAGTAFGDPFT